MAGSESFGVESGFGEQVLEWMNSEAKKRKSKFEARAYNYEISTKNFGTFEMSNHQVFMSSDMNTAVITFDADGLINFEDGEQNVGYATRASQTWVNDNGEWKVMHSHWSPRVNSQGIPQENYIFVFVDYKC